MFVMFLATNFPWNKPWLLPPVPTKVVWKRQVPGKLLSSGSVWPPPTRTSVLIQEDTGGRQKWAGGRG